MNSAIEPLDIAKIRAAIDPVNLSALRRVDIFETINSTNTYLLECAKLGGEETGWVCLAEQQTSGRGRLGKSWHSPYGCNIYGSLLWKFESEIDLSGLSIAIAVMLVRAINKYNPNPGLALKWPNDIFYEGKKLGGILLERILHQHKSLIVIGMGINVSMSCVEMQAIEREVVTLAGMLKTEVSRNQVLGFIINELLMGLPSYAKTGLSSFMEEWKQYDFLFGREISVQANSSVKTGTAAGITSKGELILKVPSGETELFISGVASDLVY